MLLQRTHQAGGSLAGSASERGGLGRLVAAGEHLGEGCLTAIDAPLHLLPVRPELAGARRLGDGCGVRRASGGVRRREPLELVTELADTLDRVAATHAVARRATYSARSSTTPRVWMVCCWAPMKLSMASTMPSMIEYARRTYEMMI